MDPTWKHPFTATISGPTSCGKTQWTLKFIKHINQMVSPFIERIVWCYSIYQDIFDEQKNIEFQEHYCTDSLVVEMKEFCILWSKFRDQRVV